MKMKKIDGFVVPKGAAATGADGMAVLDKCVDGLERGKF
jgi:hypothetical protein